VFGKSTDGDMRRIPVDAIGGLQGIPDHAPQLRGAVPYEATEILAARKCVAPMSSTLDISRIQACLALFPPGLVRIASALELVCCGARLSNIGSEMAVVDEFGCGGKTSGPRLLVSVDLPEVAGLMEPDELPRVGTLGFWFDDDVLDDPDSFSHAHFRVSWDQHARVPLGWSTGDRRTSIIVRPTLTASGEWYRDDLAELGEQLFKATGQWGLNRHRLGGYPDIGHDEILEALAEKHGCADDWVMLLQICDDWISGFSWGDVGRLTYWIRRVDLKRLRFDRCASVLESWGRFYAT